MKTFAEAREDIMSGLAADGWEMKRDLKVPHATSPDPARTYRSNERWRLWFKPQAVYLGRGDQSLAEARSLHLPDIRALDYAGFKWHLNRWIQG